MLLTTPTHLHLHAKAATTITTSIARIIIQTPLLYISVLQASLSLKSTPRTSELSELGQARPTEASLCHSHNCFLHPFWLEVNEHIEYKLLLLL